MITSLSVSDVWGLEPVKSVIFFLFVWSVSFQGEDSLGSSIQQGNQTPDAKPPLKPSDLNVTACRNKVQ